MADEEKNVVEELKEESMNQLETLREEGNDENEKVIEDSKERLNKIFDDLKDWTKDTSDPEKIKAAFEKAKEEVSDVFKSAKEKAIEVSNSENFIKTVDASKNLVIGATGLIADGFKAGADVLMRNDTVKKAVEKTSDRIDDYRDSEGLKKVVDTAEELTEKLNSTLFGGLHKFFNSDEDDGE